MEPSARLVGLQGPQKGIEVALGDAPVTIGRADGNVLLVDDPSVSRQHCVVERSEGGPLVRDLGSSHGTFVDGDRVRERLLSHGDEIAIGDSTFLVLIGDAAPAREPSLSLDEGEPIAGETHRMSVRDVLGRPSRSDPGAPGAEHDLAVLLRVNTVLASIREPRALQARLLELVAELVPAERGAILLLPRDRETLDAGEVPASTFAWTRGDGADQDVAISRTLVREVLAGRTAILANGVLDADRFAGSESLRAAAVRSVLCVPLLLHDRPIGVLSLDSSARDARFDERHLRVAAAIAGTAALALDGARHVGVLEDENRRMRADLRIQHAMAGEGPAMRKVLDLVARIGPTDSTVLVRGESGTGKELVARALHATSLRSDGPFVAINCAALPENLVESELFGHERGAFTGADARKPGKVELAEGGTLFLDEIGELPKALQAKLLRVIQERTFDRVGGTKPLRADVRLLAATNVDLAAAVREGTFRQDLLYRLDVLSITLPPLRERLEDIEDLATCFAARVAGRLGRPVPSLSPAALACLRRHDWPGNVRELENAVERAVVLGGPVIQPEDLPDAVAERAASGVDAPPSQGYHVEVAAARRRIIESALERSRGVVKDAAMLLELNPTYLHRLMTNLGIREG